MLKRVAEFISRYSMFTHGQSVGVAVSGGADSVCLLHVLRELSSRWALHLKVLHLDHQLRGEESRDDACFVHDLALRLGLELIIGQADVRQLRSTTADNLEQAARDARRDFFLACLRSGQVERIALGHTRSDQAETVLFRFLRGSGITGMAGILPVTKEGLVRPLLNVERPEVEAFLRERAITWREDSSNRDLRFTRNRIRRQLLPELTRDWNPALTRILADTAELARDEEDYWKSETDRLLAGHASRKGAALLLKAGDLHRFPLPVARRFVRRLIQQAKGDLRRVEFGHIGEILRLAGSKEGRGNVRIPGLYITRSFDWIRFSPPEGRPSDYQMPVTVPGSIILPAGNYQLEFSLSAYEEGEEALDWERVSGALEIRNWRAGDCYRPVGRLRPLKIKELFQKHRAPAWERPAWPVLISGDVILWVRRFGPAADYAARPGTRQVLKIHICQELTEFGESEDDPLTS